MGIVQQILNRFGVALLLFAAAVLPLGRAACASPTFVLLWAVPLLGHIGATRPHAPSAVRTLAIGVNWVAGVLAASLAAAAFVGPGGTFVLFPLLGCAAMLCLWNAVGLALSSLR